MAGVLLSEFESVRVGGLEVFLRPVALRIVGDDLGAVFHELCLQLAGGVTGDVAVNPEQIGDVAVQKMEGSAIGGRRIADIIIGFSGILSHCHAVRQQKIFARIFHPAEHQGSAVIGIEEMNRIAELFFIPVAEAVAFDSICLVAEGIYIAGVPFGRRAVIDFVQFQITAGIHQRVTPGIGTVFP